MVSSTGNSPTKSVGPFSPEPIRPLMQPSDISLLSSPIQFGAHNMLSPQGGGGPGYLNRDIVLTP